MIKVHKCLYIISIRYIFTKFIHKNRSFLHKKKIFYRTVYIGSGFSLIVDYMIEIENKSFPPKNIIANIYNDTILHQFP